MDILFENVITAFNNKKAWFTDNGLKPPAIIDEYQGQPENPELFEFTLPAIFMDFSIRPQKRGKIWVNDTTLIFHCLPELAPSASSISPRRTQGLSTTRWYRTIRQVLDTVNGDHYTKLMRGPEQPAFSPCGPYHTISFSTQLDELDGNEIGKYTQSTIETVNITGNPVSKYQI